MKKLTWSEPVSPTARKFSFLCHALCQLPPEEETSSQREDERVEMTMSLTPEQLDELKEAFKSFDLNNDGSLQFNEIQEVMLALGMRPTQDEMAKFMKLYDTDGNGSLEFEEFLKMMIAHLSPARRANQDQLEEAFAIFDKDKDGLISCNQFKEVMRQLVEDVSDEDVQNFMRIADLDGDGLLSLQQFRAALVEL